MRVVGITLHNNWLFIDSSNLNCWKLKHSLFGEGERERWEREVRRTGGRCKMDRGEVVEERWRQGEGWRGGDREGGEG